MDRCYSTREIHTQPRGVKQTGFSKLLAPTCCCAALWRDVLAATIFRCSLSAVYKQRQHTAERPFGRTPPRQRRHRILSSAVRVGREPVSKWQGGPGNSHKIMGNRSQVSKKRHKIPSARSPGRTLAPNICWPSVWSLLHATMPAPRILIWFLDFSKTCGPLK